MRITKQRRLQNIGCTRGVLDSLEELYVTTKYTKNAQRTQTREAIARF